jgi:hypothetical protein
MQVPDLHISTIPMNPPKHELDHTTREHSTPSPCFVPDDYLAGWVHATPTISPLLVCVINSHNGIAEVPGLPEYVASTVKSRSHGGLQWTVLNRHRQSTTLRLHSLCKLTPAQSHINHVSCSINLFLRKSISLNDELIIRHLGAKHG